jgi:membrane glycosyltransferase
MVVHRVSRVLRKCGQYQDLMLLSEGDDVAFTYCDGSYYGTDARPYAEPLFHESEDVNNIFGRKFDYTLVLDGDTGVPDGCVHELLSIAAANPERGIIQPAIKLYCNDTDTIFMQIEAMRQAIYEPMTNAVMELLGQSAYFGKAMIKNKIYIERVIGTRENPIERVPIDVLSHDTFEAALLQPLYAGSVHLLEAPSFNFVTWNIRERRWNRGEVLLAMYFWKNALGRPMRWIQKKMKGDKFNSTRLRTESNLDFVSSFIAYAALRQMMMKPFLLFYVIIHVSIHLRYKYASIIIVMFLVLLFPKFAICNKKNYKHVMVETIASILQFTPEAVVGCVRLVKAVQANLGAKIKWIPQRAVEDEFRASNCFISSFKHLWGYSVFAVLCGTIIVLFFQQAILLLALLTSLFILPFYTGVTSLPVKKNEEQHFYTSNVEIATGSAHAPGTYKLTEELGSVNKGFYSDIDTV